MVIPEEAIWPLSKSEEIPRLALTPSKLTYLNRPRGPSTQGLVHLLQKTNK